MVSILYMFIKPVSFLDKMEYIMSLYTIQNVVSFVYPSFSLTYDIYLSSSLSTNLAISICSLVFHVSIYGVYLTLYLTLVKAVTLIFKHATLSRISMSPKSALTNTDQKYQKANIDVAIQQHLTGCGAEQSVEQFVGFIMSTDIGLFIFLPFVISILIFILELLQSLAHTGARRQHKLKQFLK
jgi:hypothetical protein